MRCAAFTVPARPAAMAPGGGLPGWSPDNLAIPAPGGGWLSWSPAYPAFCLLFCPIPPTPFPGGEGGDFCYLIARGFAPCIPQGWRGAALVRRALAAPGGGLPGWSSVLPAVPAPGGGACRLCRLSIVPFAFFLAPIPPAPFPTGRGRFLLSYARGFAPCIPGAGGARHWFGGRWRRPAGGLSGWSPVLSAVRTPR